MSDLGVATKLMTGSDNGDELQSETEETDKQPLTDPKQVIKLDDDDFDGF